jgi:hypothetical protein
MRALCAAIPFVLYAAASCGSGDTTTTSKNGGDLGSADSGGQAAKSCHPTCTTAADCVVQGDPLSDAAHFTCSAGRCTWLGCQSAQECQSAGQNPKLTCATAPGDPAPTCVAGCQSAADCAVGGASGLADASHFTCESGRCMWAGCKSASECQSALGTTKVACEKPQGGDRPTCVPVCQTAADCGKPGDPLGDPSHFACKANRCVWLGCSSTSECVAATRSTKVVCE